MRPTEMKSGLRTVLTVAYARMVSRETPPLISVSMEEGSFPALREHIGRHVVEHDAVDPAGDGLADFVVVRHSDSRAARIVTPAQQFDGLGHDPAASMWLSLSTAFRCACGCARRRTVRR